MLVQCVFNLGKDIPIFTRGLGETDEANFSFLTIGENYLVYGLMFSDTGIDYLICNTGQNPYWLTSHLFKILDSQLPWQWSICLTQFSQEYKCLFDQLNVEALIGYPDLINSLAHYEGMIEREPEELFKFFKAKMSVDEWWDVNLNARSSMR